MCLCNLAEAFRFESKFKLFYSQTARAMFGSKCFYSDENHKKKTRDNNEVDVSNHRCDTHNAGKFKPHYISDRCCPIFFQFTRAPSSYGFCLSATLPFEKKVVSTYIGL